MKRATQLLLCALLGAIATACVIFLHCAYILASAGISPNSVPLLALLTDVMELHLWFAYGAVAGVVVALLATLAGRVRRLIGARELTVAPQDPDPVADPDQLIRLQRKHRAEAYLAHRRDRGGGPDAPT